MLPQSCANDDKSTMLSTRVIGYPTGVEFREYVLIVGVAEVEAGAALTWVGRRGYGLWREEF